MTISIVMNRLFTSLHNTYLYLKFFLMAPLKPHEWVHEMAGVRFYVRKATSDLFVINEVFKQHVYETPPTGIVLDLGANIGAYALYAAQTATVVYAYEPESSNFSQLTKNIELNACTNIVPIQKAVGGRESAVSLFKASVNKGASSTAQAISHNAETVHMTTLDALCKKHALENIDMLKVDIEGGEYELFAHASRDTLGRIQHIMMEMHHVPGHTPQEIIYTLTNAGFNVEHITDGSRSAGVGTSMVVATRRT